MLLQEHHASTRLDKKNKILDFMKWHAFAFYISGLLIIVSFSIICINGFNKSIDFTGGTVIEIKLEKPIYFDKMYEYLKTISVKEPFLQNTGNNYEFIIRVPPLPDANIQELTSKVLDVIHKTTNQNPKVKRIEYVGPSVGMDFIETSIMALFMILISILGYVSFRFEWRLAIGVVAALVHNVIITMGILSLIHVEFDLTVLVSLMFVIGYSLNDSIIILDRIRENFCSIHHNTPYEIFNLSLTQTLHRTLLTSSTAIIVIFMLYIFGATILKGFSLTMLIGVLIGKISSIYVVSSLALKLKIKPEHFLLQRIKKEGVD